MGKGKRTADQQEIHRMAVDIRKLTDEQIVERIMHERDTAYKVGYGSGRTDAINDMKKLLRSSRTLELSSSSLTPDQIREAVSKCAG